MSTENSLEEYKIISENLRWYSNMRFAQLTLFVAITAALANWLFSDKFTTFVLVAPALKMIGVIVSSLFWYLEMRADDYWSHFMKRAVELEKGLKFKQYTNRPLRRPRTTIAIRIFIAAVGIIWLAFLFL